MVFGTVAPDVAGKLRRVLTGGWCMFEQVTREIFLSEMESVGSARFQRALKRIDYELAFPDYSWADWLIHRGDLTRDQDFSAPGYNLLVLGDLTAKGLVDLNCAECDEGGFCAIIGYVTCRAFTNHYAKATIVDGDLVASEMIINAYEDSGLWVTSDLRTKFFYGEDIWAEVGGRADMEYGIGYCLPLGYIEAAGHVIRPHHNEEESRQLLNFGDDDKVGASELLQLLTEGKPLFKS
jgi:hypothetical protein